MANMAAKQRAGEVDLMVEVMENLGAPVIGRITSPATLEGQHQPRHRSIIIW